MSATYHPDHVLHQVNLWHLITGYVLRLRIPRSRCGVLMTAGPGIPELGPDAPLCPACHPTP